MKKRNINIDVVKCLALFLVVSVHFFGKTGYSATEYGGLTMKISLFLRNISMACVPLFIMTTGYLIGRKTFSLKLYKSIFNVFITYVFAMIIISLYVHGLHIDKTFVKDTIMDIFMYRQYGWYVEMYMCLVIFAPVINTCYGALKTKKEKIFLLFSIALLTTFPITLIEIVMQNKTYGGIRAFVPDYFIDLWPVMYYVIGVYLKDNMPNITKLKAFTFFMGSSFLAFLVYYLFSAGEIFVEAKGHVNIFITLITTTLFILVMKLDFNFNKYIEKLIIFISNNTLPAYLLSIIIDVRTYSYIDKHFYDVYSKLHLYPLVVVINFVQVILFMSIFVFVKNIFKKLVATFRG